RVGVADGGARRSQGDRPSSSHRRGRLRRDRGRDPAAAGRAAVASAMAAASTRFFVYALVIAVPTIIVAVLGYVSLRQWERSAELLFREQARDVAAMAVDKIEMLVRQSDDEVLARLGAIVESADPSPARLEAFVRDTPLV